MNFETRSISSSAVLVELNLSVLTGNKLDREESEKVSESNNASKRAARVTKNIFAGSETLKDIIKYAAKVRQVNTGMTMPWNDSGTRLLPSTLLIEHQTTMSEHREEFNDLVEQFKQELPELRENAREILGDLYKESDYQGDWTFMSKFNFDCAYIPVPDSGDFRIDVGNKAKDELVQQFEGAITSRVDAALRDGWTRLYKVLQRMSKQLTDNEDGTPKRLFRSLLVNAEDLVTLLKAFNVTNDSKLEEARLELHQILQTADLDDLKTCADARENLKDKVDDVISKFDF